MNNWNIDRFHDERIAKGPPKERDIDFEGVAGPRSETIAKAHLVGPEEMDVKVPRTPEEPIFEVVMFQVGD